MAYIDICRLYCGLSCTDVELFRTHISLHTRTSKVSHSRPKRDSNQVASNLYVWQPSVFGQHGAFRSKEYIPLVYVHRSPPDKDYLTKLTASVPFLKKVFEAEGSFVFCCAEVLTSNTLPSVAGVARGRPSPRSRLTFHLS